MPSVNSLPSTPNTLWTSVRHLTVGRRRGVGSRLRGRRVRGGAGRIRRAGPLALGSRLEVIIVPSTPAVDELLTPALEHIEVVAEYAPGTRAHQGALSADITCAGGEGDVRRWEGE